MANDPAPERSQEPTGHLGDVMLKVLFDVSISPACAVTPILRLDDMVFDWK